MNRSRIVATTGLFLLFLLPGCDQEKAKTHSREQIRSIIENQARAMMMNGVGQMGVAGNFSDLRAGAAVGLGIFSPINGGDVSTVNSNSSTDTSYYDPITGQWTFHYEGDGYSGTMKYQFIPHDNEGLPTTQTDHYTFDAEYQGSYADTWSRSANTYSGQSHFDVIGLKDWIDESKTGELTFNGNSASSYNSSFAPDTMVSFAFSDVTDHVLMKEGDCVPRSGFSEYHMAQDATPDSFTVTYHFSWPGLDSLPIDFSYSIPYEDFSYNGKTTYTQEGITYTIDGEDLYYPVNCDSMMVWGLRKSLRKTR